MRIRLLKDVDFQGVLRKKGWEVEAVRRQSGGFAVQMGIGSYLDLTEGIEAEEVKTGESASLSSRNEA